MKKFVQQPSRTQQVCIAIFEFADSSYVGKEDTQLQAIIGDLTYNKLTISWKDGILVSDCPSGEYMTIFNREGELELYEVSKYDSFWKSGDCSNELY